MKVTPEQLEVACKKVGQALEETLPKLVGVDERLGFAVFLFDFGDRGSIAYVSNAKRNDMITAVKEWLVQVGDP